MPARRWLLRPGGSLSGHYYLLEGRVRLLLAEGSVVVTAGAPRAREAVYPGALGVETLAPSVFLRREPEAVAGSEPEQPLGLPELSADQDAWQHRFLSSPLMQRFDPPSWQRVLRAMSRESHAAGSHVIERGSPAACCFVLCSGRAEVLAADGAAVLAILQPGSLFGEDALITGVARNASVVMRTPGDTVSLPAGPFAAWLLQTVGPPLAEVGGRRLLCLDALCRRGPAGAVVLASEVRRALPGLQRDAPYAVTGGTAPERLLAAFLLAQAGIHAQPLES